MLYATDASPSGAGVCVAPISTVLVPRVGADGWSFVQRHVQWVFTGHVSLGINKLFRGMPCLCLLSRLCGQLERVR